MNQTTWVVTLNYNKQERLEDRVANIVNYMAQQYPNAQWHIFNIDATRIEGDRLTHYGNIHSTFTIFSQDLLTLLQEEGQVIELDVSLIDCQQELLKISIRDGISVDVLGVEKCLPKSVLGDYFVNDASLFLWQEEPTTV